MTKIFKPADAADTASYKVGNIALPINDIETPYIPASCDIINNVDELQTIALGVKKNMPVLLIGDTGTGKTSFIRYLAHKTNNSFRRLNLNGGTTNDEIKGHYVLDENNKMRWIDGILTEAMKNGYWLLLDELNACLPEITFTLHSLMDDDRYLVLDEHEGEIVRPHKNFRIFATMNPSLEYAGTKDLNKALLSRFAIVVQTKYQAPETEMNIIKSHVPSAKETDLALMVRVAEGIRQGKDAGTVSFICSTRELINWAMLAEDMPLKDAAVIAILNKCETKNDKTTVEDILKLHFGKWEKKRLPTFKELEAQLSELEGKLKIKPTK